MLAFDYQPVTRIVFGPGRIAELGTLAREFARERVLVVSDPHLVAIGHTQRGIDALTQAGLAVTLFDGVQENPTTADVESGRQVAAELRPELIVAIGGGSSMDCAKGINFVYSCGGAIQDYWGVGKATGPLLPMIAVPTTSGTGSETQSFALISDAETHVKMACGDRRASFRIALLDPELTRTQPPRVTALTGIDALAHAIETYVTTRRNEVSLAFSREAWRLLSANFHRVLEEPNDLDARSAMQLGACFAGLAIENSMLGAAHVLANPLTARFGVVHGEAIAVMLPHVVRYNGRQFGTWYADLIEWDGSGHRPPAEAAEELAELLSKLAAKAGLATRLADLKVPEGALVAMAADAATQWTGTFNPRKVGESELLDLYRQAW